MGRMGRKIAKSEEPVLFFCTSGILGIEFRSACALEYAENGRLFGIRLQMRTPNVLRSTAFGTEVRGSKGSVGVTSDC